MILYGSINEENRVYLCAENIIGNDKYVDKHFNITKTYVALWLKCILVEISCETAWRYEDKWRWWCDEIWKQVVQNSDDIAHCFLYRLHVGIIHLIPQTCSNSYLNLSNIKYIRNYFISGEIHMAWCTKILVILKRRSKSRDKYIFIKIMLNNLLVLFWFGKLTPLVNTEGSMFCILFKCSNALFVHQLLPYINLVHSIRNR